MTSQIAIFNSLGVALASDTVTTHTSGGSSKTTNNAEKILLVGPDHLVAVAHSGSVEMNWTHLRNVLTAWSSTLHGPLPHLSDYPSQLVEWLSNDQDLLLPSSDLDVVADVLSEHFSRVYTSWRKYLANGSAESEADALLAAASGASDYLRERPSYAGAAEASDQDLLDVEGVDFGELAAGWFGEIQGFEQALPSLRTSSVLALTRRQDMPFDSELGFVGYGSKDHFASSVRVRFRGRYGGVVRAHMSEPFGVSNVQSSPAAYQTFAQADAVHGFLRGAQWAVTGAAVDHVWGAVYSAVEGENVAAIADTVAASVRDHLDEFCNERFSQPILNTIGGMSLLNLAELATSLVGMQAMFSSAAGSGSATVGGFIETLLISRSHGVQWVNRIPGAPM